MVTSLKFEKVTQEVLIEFEDWQGHVAQTVLAYEQVIRNPHLISEAIQRAMADVMLPVLREALIRGMPKVVDMHIVRAAQGKFKTSSKYQAIEELGQRRPDVGNQNATEGDDAYYNHGLSGNEVVHNSPRANPTIEGLVMKNLYKRMLEAHQRVDLAGYTEAAKRFYSQNERYRMSLQRLKNNKQKRSHYLSSGEFRKRAIEIMDHFLDPSMIQGHIDDNSATAGIGSLAWLDRVDTPSATQYKLGRGRTGSKYNILWRQMEFGTGAFAEFKDMKDTTSRYNTGLANGQWYYGKTLRFAPLILTGSEGIGMLYGKNGVASHSLEFLDAVGREVSKLLLGHLRNI